MYNISFLKKYVPAEELAEITGHRTSEDKEFFEDKLQEIEQRIKAIPPLYGNEDKGLKGSQVHLHYFFGGTDIYISELDPESGTAFGFTCLNGDKYNAELGYQYIPEIIAIKGMNLDLYWDNGTTLADIMKKYKGEA